MLKITPESPSRTRVLVDNDLDGPALRSPGFLVGVRARPVKLRLRNSRPRMTGVSARLRRIEVTVPRISDSGLSSWDVGGKSTSSGPSGGSSLSSPSPELKGEEEELDAETVLQGEKDPVAVVRDEPAVDTPTVVTPPTSAPKSPGRQLTREADRKVAMAMDVAEMNPTLIAVVT